MKVLHVINTLRGGGAEMNVLRLMRHANRGLIEIARSDRPISGSA
jgi:hypothetical protein